MIATLLLPPAIAAEVPAVQTIQSPITRVVIVWLKNKTDILDGLKRAVAREKIKNAVFISGFGSVTSYQYPHRERYGARRKGPCARHSTPAKALGGHLEPGTSLFTFASITLGILSDAADLTRVDDYTWR